MTEKQVGGILNGIRNKSIGQINEATNGQTVPQAPTARQSPLCDLANRLMDIIEHHEKYRYGGEANGPWRATVFAYLIHKALGTLGDFERIAPYLEAYIIAHQKGMCYAPDDPRLVASAFGIPVEAVPQAPPFEATQAAAPAGFRPAEPLPAGQLHPEVLETMLGDIDAKTDDRVARALAGRPTIARYEQESNGAGFALAVFPLEYADRVEAIIAEGRTRVSTVNNVKVQVEG